MITKPTNTAAAATDQTAAYDGSDAQSAVGAEAVPFPRLPGHVVLHPVLGELWDRMAMHQYAMRYSDLCASVKSTANPETPVLAPKHNGMRVDYSGLLDQASSVLRVDPEQQMVGEALRQLGSHLKELGERWYAGDEKVVDEFLQLYCIEPDARNALVDRVKDSPAQTTSAPTPSRPAAQNKP